MPTTPTPATVIGNAPPCPAIRAASIQGASSNSRPPARACSPARKELVPSSRTVATLRAIQTSLCAAVPARAAWNSCCAPRVMSTVTGSPRSRARPTSREPRAQASSWVKRVEHQAALLLLHGGDLGGPRRRVAVGHRAIVAERVAPAGR